MSEPIFTEEDAVLQVRLAILDAQKLAKHTQEFVICADRWLALADFLRPPAPVRRPGPYARPA